MRGRGGGGQEVGQGRQGGGGGGGVLEGCSPCDTWTLSSGRGVLRVEFSCVPRLGCVWSGLGWFGRSDS